MENDLKNFIEMVLQKVIENHFIELVLKWNKFLKQQHHQLGNQMQKHQHVIHVMFHSHYLIEYVDKYIKYIEFLDIKYILLNRDTTADIVVKYFARIVQTINVSLTDLIC